MNYRTDVAFAKEMDAADPLAKYRDEFYICLLYTSPSPRDRG